MKSVKQKEEKVVLDQQADTVYSRTAVLDSLSTRISKDVGDALKYIDLHEIIGILEMIKISITTEMLNASAKQISDEVIGERTVN